MLEWLTKLGDGSAGRNRHMVGHERALQERRSDSILTSSLAPVVVRRPAKRMRKSTAELLRKLGAGAGPNAPPVRKCIEGRFGLEYAVVKPGANPPPADEQ